MFNSIFNYQPAIIGAIIIGKHTSIYTGSVEFPASPFVSIKAKDLTFNSQQTPIFYNGKDLIYFFISIFCRVRNDYLISMKLRIFQFIATKQKWHCHFYSSAGIFDVCFCQTCMKYCRKQFLTFLNKYAEREQTVWSVSLFNIRYRDNRTVSISNIHLLKDLEGLQL